MVHKTTKWMAVLIFLVSASLACGQAAESPDLETDWQVSFVSGYFTGGTFLRTTQAGEPISAKADDGLLLGVRLGAEKEFLGWELTLAAVFADLDVKGDPFAVSGSMAQEIASAEDYALFLASINANWFFTGNDWAQGRVRPFLTAGPGLVHLTSDFSEADNETMFEFNLGAGIKFLLGDEGNPVLRFDWRWHMIVGSTAGLENAMYRQELSAGIGIRF